MSAREALGIALMELGLALGLGAILVLLHVVPSAGLNPWIAGAALLALGGLAGFLAVLVPAPLQRAACPSPWLDAFVATYQFVERHELRVAAPPEAVFAAIESVPSEEIALFRTLTWLRKPRLPGHVAAESILAAPRGEPILGVATRTGFLPLVRDPVARLLAVGLPVIRPRGTPVTAETFASANGPGLAKALLAFSVDDVTPTDCRLVTETRVWAADRATARRFAAYWRIIYPGSAWIRRAWLAAIRRRAEKRTSV
jgi:hypothetical protein